KLAPPDGASVHSMVALDPPWMAAIGSPDIFLSFDGQTWKPCARLPAGVEVHDVAPLSGKSLLLATSVGLRVSADLCRSWQPFGRALEGNTIQAICRHPVRKSVLFAARYGVIYTSPDGGRSWAILSPEACPAGSVKQMLVVPGVPDRLFVLTPRQGVFMLPLDQ